MSGSAVSYPEDNCCVCGKGGGGGGGGGSSPSPTTAPPPPAPSPPPPSGQADWVGRRTLNEEELEAEASSGGGEAGEPNEPNATWPKLELIPTITIDHCFRVNDLQLCGEMLPTCVVPDKRPGFLRQVFNAIKYTFVPMSEDEYLDMMQADDPKTLEDFEAMLCKVYTMLWLSSEHEPSNMLWLSSEHGP